MQEGPGAFAFGSRRDGGFVLSNAFRTLPCSTGRVELAAFLCALYVERPLHVGTDASYVLKGVEDIREDRIDLVRRPGLLRVDGDLWQIVEEAYTARGGSDTMRLTKVRAHQPAQQA